MFRRMMLCAGTSEGVPDRISVRKGCRSLTATKIRRPVYNQAAIVRQLTHHELNGLHSDQPTQSVLEAQTQMPNKCQ